MAKTAGTTLRTVLERQYPDCALFVFSGNDEVDRQEWGRVAGREEVLVLGHAPLVTGVAGVDCLPTITLLREPVARVCSFCRHVAGGKSPHLRDAFPPERFDLDAFLESGDPELANLQTKMLLNKAPTAGEAASRELDRSVAVEEAFRVLIERITAFGIQEFFDESLVWFSDRMGWKWPLYKSQNQSEDGGRLRFEERQLQRIAELNAIDIAFYRLAREHFLRQVACDPLFRVRVAAFRFVNRAIRPHAEYLRWRMGMN